MDVNAICVVLSKPKLAKSKIIILHRKLFASQKCPTSLDGFLFSNWVNYTLIEF